MMMSCVLYHFDHSLKRHSGQGLKTKVEMDDILGMIVQVHSCEVVFLSEAGVDDQLPVWRQCCCVPAPHLPVVVAQLQLLPVVVSRGHMQQPAVVGHTVELVNATIDQELVIRQPDHSVQ